jgi:DNA segregation ATPase FtsK/SpoIIIE, S-DNA-T family
VNFPSRISFRVTAKIDSRTILDCSGADKLLGRGDMLFLDATTACLRRVHGAYITAQEIEVVVQHIRAERTVQYLDIPHDMSDADQKLNPADDHLYAQVIDFLSEADEISISLLQRKFKIGYNRSARIIEFLELKGMILPSNGTKTRKVVR